MKKNLLLLLFTTLFVCLGWSQTNTLVGNLTVQKKILLLGDLAPTALASNQNDYAPTGIADALILRLTSSGNYSVTGIVPGTSPEGRLLLIYNVNTSADTITLINDSASSAAANRLRLGADVVLDAGGPGLMVFYDNTTLRWRAVGGSGTGGGGGGGDGSVTSVALDLPASIFDVSGSPVTTSGTLTGALKTQTANLIFAGPNTGSAAVPTFRALVDADIPAAIARDAEVTSAISALSSVYQPLDGDLTAIAALSTTGFAKRTGTNTWTAASLVSGDIPDLSATYLTVATAASTYVPLTRTVNGHALSANVTVTATDVGLGSVEDAAASTLYVPLTRTVNGHALSANVTVTATDVGLGSVENAAASTLYVPLTRTVNGHALSSDVTVTKGDVGLGNVENTALSTWAGTANIDTLGTITTGVWNGTAIGDAYISSASSWNSKQAGDATLTALAAFNTNGFLVQTASDTFAGRTLTGTADKIDISNGNGVSANPVFTISATYAGQTSITTLGTIATGTWSATTIAVNKGGTGVTSLGDITRTNDTNVTLTLGGTPNGAVITSTSFTLGWTGVLAAARGGTGQIVYTTGDILVATSSTTLAPLNAVAVGQVLVSAGTSTAPAWSATPRLSGLGLGVAGASGPLLSITNNSGGLPTVYSTSQVLVHVGNTDAASPAILIDGSGGGGLLEFRRASGTLASPTQLTNGTIIGTVGWRGYGTTVGFTNRRAEISAVATESWTNTANGSKIVFNVTAATTTTTAEAMSLTSALLTVVPAVTVSSTTDSSSASTGSIVTAGGLGVAKKGWFGDTVTVTAATPMINLSTTSSSSGLGHLFNLTNGASYYSRNLTFDGTNWNLDDTGAGGGVLAVSPTAISFRYATAGSNPRTLVSGYQWDLTNGLTVQSGKLAVSDTTDASSPTVASAAFAGGIGVSKLIWGKTGLVLGATGNDGAMTFNRNTDGAAVATFGYTHASTEMRLNNAVGKITFGVSNVISMVINANGSSAFIVPDSNNAINLSGTTKGIRMGTTSTGGLIEGVDTTGTGSYQPMAVGGSSVLITNSGATLATFNSSGLTVSNAITTNAADGAGFIRMVASGATSSFRGYSLQTSAVDRWFLGASNEAESGSNVGTNFVIYSYTDAGGGATLRLQINRNNGLVRMAAYGAGTLVTDSSGNVTASSDEKLKTVGKSFTRGLDDLKKLKPTFFSWNKKSGLNTKDVNVGFTAQNVQLAIPEAVSMDPQGYMTLNERPILAAVVNAIGQLDVRLAKLEAKK